MCTVTEGIHYMVQVSQLFHKNSINLSFYFIETWVLLIIIQHKKVSNLYMLLILSFNKISNYKYIIMIFFYFYYIAIDTTEFILFNNNIIFVLIIWACPIWFALLVGYKWYKITLKIVCYCYK